MVADLSHPKAIVTTKLWPQDLLGTKDKADQAISE
jgi:hypothetical protein